MVRYQHPYPLRQRTHRTLRQQISFPFTHAKPPVKTPNLDFSLRPIHYNRKAHSRIKKSDSWLSLSFFLSEIQNIGTGGRSTPHPSTSLFRTDIPLNHPLKPLLEASLNSILQAVSPRTLQSYLTAWKSFKTFHSTYNLPFPTFSLLAITSFISHLNINKKLQTSSIKGYLSGLQFFHKLLYGSPSAHIANSQTSLLIKGIQKTNPTRPDSRQPITLKILTKCISTLRRGYHSIHTAPHTRRHVYPGLFWLPQMLWARHLIQFRPSHPPHYLRSSGAGRRNHFLHH